MGKYALVNTRKSFQRLLEQLNQSSRIAFDTEFVPEYSYSPQLCLIQVATDEEISIIDPFAVEDFSGFWKTLVDSNREVIVHAGREELGFCYLQTNELPAYYFDVQIAAGLIGLGYPLSLSNLVQSTVGSKPSKAETRSDWRKRPLSDRQLSYAADDVRYLLAARDRLGEKLRQLQRLDWMDREMDSFKEEFLDREQEDNRTRRVSGAGGMSPRQAAVLKELALWREDRAKRLNKPTRWILRDDLMIELSKRQPVTLADLQRTRGIGDVARATWAAEIADAIKHGVDIPEEDLPKSKRRKETPDEQMVLKILSAVLIRMSETKSISYPLICGNEDLRDFLDWHHSGRKETELPMLAKGWRGELCMDLLTGILDGSTSIRLDPDSTQHRILFEQVKQKDAQGT